MLLPVLPFWLSICLVCYHHVKVCYPVILLPSKIEGNLVSLLWNARTSYSGVIIFVAVPPLNEVVVVVGDDDDVIVDSDEEKYIP